MLNLWNAINRSPQDDYSGNHETIENHMEPLNEKCVASDCTSVFTLKNLNYVQTGFYGCHYNDTSHHQIFSESRAQMNWIYIFVNDEDELLVPYEGNDFIFMLVVQSTPVTIPCE